MTNTPKQLNVTLAALTRVQYSATVEVPADFDTSEADDVIDRLYDQTDGGEFVDDTDYWEKGFCTADEINECQPVDFRFEDGELIAVESSAPAAPQPTLDNPPGRKQWRVIVTQECDDDALDSDDKADFFVLGKGGRTTVAAGSDHNTEDDVLDWFHNSFAIACLDDYTFEVEHDSPGSSTTTRDDDSKVTYTPHIDQATGAVGFKATHDDGRIQYVMLNPSGGSDDGVPNVFVYSGDTGNPGDDHPEMHVCLFQDS